MSLDVAISIGEIDGYLSETGQFTLVEWLLRRNLLPYADYERWRNGELPALDSAVKLKSDALQTILTDVTDKAKSLKLSSEEQNYFCWQGTQRKLLLSRDASLNSHLGLVWKRPEDIPQMDLFMDNSAVVCENQVQFDLAARDYARAQTTLQRLTDLNPSHAKLGAFQDLINYGLHLQGSAHIEPEDIPAEFEGLQTEVQPLAKETLKHHARDYLAAAWRRLANSMAKSASLDHSVEVSWPFHASYALSQIPDWPAVKTDLTTNKQAYSTPELTQLLANAFFYSEEPNIGFVIWGQIAERFPDFIEQHIGGTNAVLIELWDGFLAFDEHWPNEWFLSYLLIQRPGFVHFFPALAELDAVSIKNPINQVTFDLVSARIRDEDQNLHRAKLKTSAPALLRCYMNKRDWFNSLDGRR